MQLRNARNVAERAVAMGAVAFRASLEISNDPRCAVFAAQIFDWLRLHGVAEALDVLEIELLSTPYGQLARSQAIDANWAGEGAAVLCWSLGLEVDLPILAHADQASVISTLHIMQPEVADTLQGAILRNVDEIVLRYKNTRLMKTLLREAHVLESDLDDEAKATANALGRQLVQAELANTSVEITGSDFDAALQAIRQTSSESRQRMAGIYLVRDVAITWLFDGRSRYFQED